MKDLKANLISIAGIGTMLAMAGLPAITTVAIWSFAIGGLLGIAIAKNNKK